MCVCPIALRSISVEVNFSAIADFLQSKQWETSHVRWVFAFVEPLFPDAPFVRRLEWVLHVPIGIQRYFEPLKESHG